MKQVIVHKGRTNVITVSLGYDASNDAFTSEIREEEDVSSELIAAWTVTFENDGTDGELRLTMDNLISGAITQSKGYMDIKRITGGEPVSVFDDPLEVLFKGVVTA